MAILGSIYTHHAAISVVGKENSATFPNILDTNKIPDIYQRWFQNTLKSKTNPAKVVTKLHNVQNL